MTCRTCKLVIEALCLFQSGKIVPKIGLGCLMHGVLSLGDIQIMFGGYIKFFLLGS
jgi:hypothetical protein